MGGIWMKNNILDLVVDIQFLGIRNNCCVYEKKGLI